MPDAAMEIVDAIVADDEPSLTYATAEARLRLILWRRDALRRASPLWHLWDLFGGVAVEGLTPGEGDGRVVCCVPFGEALSADRLLGEDADLSESAGRRLAASRGVAPMACFRVKWIDFAVWPMEDAQ